jgi:hypothetical protein
VGVVRRPEVLREWRAGIRPPRSMAEHARELVAAYARRREASSEGAAERRSSDPTAGAAVA